MLTFPYLFIFIKNKRPCVISSEGFSALEKNVVICPQRAMLSIQSGIKPPAADSHITHMAHFFNMNFLGRRCKL
jgi:hypothetical protein